MEHCFLLIGRQEINNNFTPCTQAKDNLQRFAIYLLPIHRSPSNIVYTLEGCVIIFSMFLGNDGSIRWFGLQFY